MKVISKIYKQHDSRVGQCLDGEIVSLVSWLDEGEIKTAINAGRTAYAIFKVKKGNKSYPLGHPLGGYIDSSYCTIVL